MGQLDVPMSYFCGCRCFPEVSFCKQAGLAASIPWAFPVLLLQTLVAELTPLTILGAKETTRNKNGTIT